jgi:hypothetical protein
MRCTMLFALLPLIFTSLACAQNITREYDVRPLLTEIPDFADAPDLAVRKPASATQPSGLFSNGPEDSKPQARAAVAAQLVASVNTILTGVDGASVREDGGNLHVVAPAEAQERVKTAIDLAIHDRLLQINLEIRMLQLPLDVLSKLDRPLRQRVDQAMMQQRLPVLLSEEQKALLLRSTQAHANATVTTAPRMTFFNGQRAYVLVATQRAYITGYRKDTAGKFQPDVEVAEAGMLVECRAASGDAAVSLDLHVQIAQLLDTETKPWPDAPVGEKLEIQVPNQRILELSRLLTLPDGGSALLHLPATEPAKTDPNFANLAVVSAKLVRPKDDHLRRQ